MALLAACQGDTQPKVVPFPEAASPQAQLMLAKCGACHAAPHPKVHSAGLWPGIVYRMQLHMRTTGVASLTDAEMDVIVNYLQRHASTKKES